MIESEKAIYTVSRMCRLLEVSRSGFYKWYRSRDNGPSPSAQRRAELDARVADSTRPPTVSTAPHASWPICGPPARRYRASRSRHRCAARAWPGFVRGGSRRAPRWLIWTRRYRPTW